MNVVKILMTAALAFTFVPVNSQESNTDRFIKILKKSAYDEKQLQHFPDFTYQSADNPYLTDLRKNYNLDSIAGQASDINRVLNLLEWMHQAVPHEDEVNHQILNAQYIIRTYKEKAIAQGCYPLAIAMNEILLSMGFHSRIVICFPSDLNMPNGGHVINTVYIPSFKKWIWIDPQYNAYLKNKKGDFLSIEEVREYIIRKKPIVLNKDADYHGDPIDLTYYMDEFMVEHLYRFVSPVHSEYNSETRDSGKILNYVELIPSNAKEIPSKGSFESHENGDIKVETYHTNNPKAFWKLP